MTTISDLKKKILVQKEPSQSAQYILDAIMKFDNLSLDDFPDMAEEKRNWIQEQINSKPNPLEISEWENIESQAQPYADAPLLPSTIMEAQSLTKTIEDYIRRWESTRPNGNHVDDAHILYEKIEGLIRKERERLEENDWNSVDIDSIPSLLGHLNKYPNSVHKNDIDDLCWELTNMESLVDVNQYLLDFPNGRHANDALSVRKAIEEWTDVKQSDDINVINEYIRKNPYSPFVEKAKTMMQRLKQKELKKMKDAPNAYEVGMLKYFLENSIFSKYELINEGVITQSILDSLDSTYDLPDIKVAMDNSIPECKEGHTDIYFFGIPSTGKSCILMGLTSSDDLRINLAHGGGDYAAALQEYVDAGVTIPQTPMKFVATLEGTIIDRNGNAEHRINLIEMAGEEFALQIAGNKDHVYDFEAMGTGATELLRNDNKKVFFLIIDPTATVISYNRREIVHYDEETGEPVYGLVPIRCKQKTLIEKMVNLLEYEGNADIMKKVDAIHIIMTKSDLLGNEYTRDDKAVEKFYDDYSDILEPIADLCKRYSINIQSDYRPKLYTFSLGKFYVGGFYEYDPTDSNKLVDAMRSTTTATRKRNFWDKVKDIMN